jgi:hypothetical protein
LQLKAEKQATDAQFTQQELDIKKAALLQEQALHQDNLQFNDANKAADREHELVKNITGARTALMNAQSLAQTENINQTIRDSNKQTFV